MAFNILSIDSGGVRGIFPAKILQKIQKEYGVDFTDFFDLIIGTSTGSIIATALAIQFPLQNVVQFYENASNTILLPQKFSLNGFLKSKYHKEQLEKAVYSAVGDLTFAAVKTRLIIPSTDIANAELYNFKSAYLPELEKNNEVRLVDAIVASCSAPLYFDPHVTDGRLLSDGGLWAKNPALLGVVEALGILKQKAKDVRVFSLGTGVEKVKYDMKEMENKNWGLMREWHGEQLALAFLHYQGRAAERMVETLIPKKNYVRLDFEYDGALRMDDTVIVPELEHFAEETFASRHKEITMFFSDKKEDR